MTVFYGTMTSKGQTTVPAEVRDMLKLKPGDKIRYVVRDGEVVIRAKNKRLIDLAGRFADPSRQALSEDELQNAIADAAIEHLTGGK
jgi:antitoxin PrlF